MIVLKSSAELKLMAEPCDIVREVLEKVQDFIKPGITTKDVDKFAENIIVSRSAFPSFKGVRDYSHATCVSVNEVIVHGIPGDRVLNEGDIVSVDVGAFKNGFHGDACRTYAVGTIQPEYQKLIDVTRESFFKGVEQFKPDNRLTDISAAIQGHVEEHGFGVVRDFFGHGIGRNLHEEPSVPHFGKPNRGPRLRVGMVLAIEPMVTFGDYRTKTLADGWTSVTKDGSFAAHYENTVALTNNGPVILTL